MQILTLLMILHNTLCLNSIQCTKVRLLLSGYGLRIWTKHAWGTHTWEGALKDMSKYSGTVRIFCPILYREGDLSVQIPYLLTGTGLGDGSLTYLPTYLPS